ncbi:MAG: non-heme iron oxygenase ferredoxin subunit [Chloroflexota bacterium]|nr:non-heme iron oxygenase ferredoxin subunit [Chloroflexota bacterium]
MIEFFKVTTKEQLQPGKMVSAWVGGRKVLLYNVAGEFYATDEQCTHRECSLEEGKLAGNVISCPCHGARFDVTTGAVLNPPAKIALPAHPVKLEGNNVLVGIDTADIV